MTLLFTDPVFLQHETGHHPERPARLQAILAKLEKSRLLEKCQPASFEPLSEAELSSVHSSVQILTAKGTAERGGGFLDADTVVSPDSFRVALAASGACVAAVDAVVTGKGRNALCLVRPPGHHANQTRSMGFCLFNNIALSAKHAMLAHQLKRVMIVDWDVHHGNGTQDIFYDDPSVMFFSIHRYGHGFYPGTGSASDTGEGPGLGFTLNMPVRFGTSRKDYLACFSQTLEKAAAKIKPELVLLSAGFDAHVQDPIGSLGLETEDFQTLTREVMAVADTYAGGRLVSCLEGGYHLEALAESVQAHLEILLGHE